MADNGLFYFLNHHGAAGAQKPSDYPFGMFSVKAWGPLPSPQPHLFHGKQHYEVILGTKQPGSQLPLYFDSITETLWLIMAMGVDVNIITFCDRLVHSDIQEAEQEYLASLREIILSKSVASALKQISLLSPPDKWIPVNYYISGLLKLFRNDLKGVDDDFRQALSTGLAGFAKTRALICLGLLSYQREERETYIKQAIQNSPQFQAEFEESLGKNITIPTIKGSYKFAFPNLEIVKRSRMLPILNKLVKTALNIGPFARLFVKKRDK